jgi:hypothetical protein
VDAKPDEIPAVRVLLRAFTDLAGAVITAGALHTQGDTAQAITGRYAGYVMTVKAGMPALCRQLEKLPWTAIPATSAVSMGPAAVRSPLRAPAAPVTGTPGSAAVVEGHVVAVGVREREGAAERPVGGR